MGGGGSSSMYLIPLPADEAGCLYSQASHPLDIKSRVGLVAADGLCGWRWAGVMAHTPLLRLRGDEAGPQSYPWCCCRGPWTSQC